MTDDGRNAAAAGHEDGHRDSGAPAVSVITIFWNTAAFLAEAVDSIRAQTLRDWELLLVDDGSTDGSAAIARDCAGLDGRIRLLTHPGRRNLGTACSRNLGLEAARGRFIAFLDADDVYEPERLARHVDVLRRHPGVGTVISRERYWRQWTATRRGVEALLPDHEVGPFAELETVLPPPRLLYSILATPGAPMPGICSITFRRELLAATGLIPPRFTDQYEDQALIAKLLIEAPAYVLDACLARYRQHPASLTHRAEKAGDYRPGRPHEARDRYLDWLAAYLRERRLWTDAWERTLADGHSTASGRRGNGPGTDRLRRIGRLLAAGILPSRVARPVIRQLWRLRDASTRRRALRTAERMDVPGGGAS